MPKSAGLNLKMSRPNYARALLSLWQVTEVGATEQEAVYRRILSVAQQLLHVDHASIWWQESGAQGAELVCICASDDAFSHEPIALSELTHYWAHLQQHSLMCCDNAMHQLPQHQAIVNEWQPYLASQQSMMHVRLMSDGQLLGVMRLERLRAHHWMEDEKTFAALLAEQVVHEHEHEARASMQHELELISRVFTASRDAIIVLSHLGEVQKVNPAFSAITGFTADEIIGHHYPSWVNAGGQTAVDFAAMCHLVCEEGHWQGELLQRRKGKTAQMVWQTMLAVKDNLGTITNFIAIETDLSGFKEAQARVHYLSHYDALTGLANRVEQLEQLAHMIEVAHSMQSQVVVLCLDIDDFKKVNLSLGHTLGDQLLMNVSARLKRLGDVHGVWARLSADEYSYVAPLVALQADVEAFMQGVLDELQLPFALGGQQVRLTASLGCAHYPQDAHDAESLLRAAQTAMRAMKQLGGNGYKRYVSTMNNQAVERLLLENQLAYAVSKR